VRGYFENEPESERGSGGQLLLLGSVEIRFPLVWIVSGALFTDAGNVWERPSDLGLRRLGPFVGGGAGYSDIRYSAGGGLRIGTPVGPVRFDFGWKLRRGRPSEPDLSPARGVFHFSLGQAF
jgi:outer membrane protein insertion porin family